jgi:hypothetical protein
MSSLEQQMPTLAQFADLNRDARGGLGRKELDDQTYQDIDAAYRAGASPDDVRERHSIGYVRADRMRQAYQGRSGE